MYKRQGQEGLTCGASLRREGGGTAHVKLGGEAFEAVPGCRVTMMDVTQRRSAAEELARQRDHLGLLNEALRESEEKYRTVADFTYDWEAWRAPDGTYRYVSPSCARITGHAAAEFLADPGLVGRITHPDDREKVVDHYRAGAHEARREGQQIDFRILTPGGETRWISHLCTGVHGKDGEWLGRRESNRDITKRKQVEEELRDEHWRMERIIEGTQAGTWEWNVQTGQAAFNEVWAGIIGYTLDELAPVSIKTWESFVHPADLQLSAEQLERHFTGELPSYDCECRMRHKDGHWVWVHDRGRVMTRTDDGRPLTMFGTHTDITLRKQAEEALRESDARFKKLTLHQFVLEWRKSRSSGSGGSGGSRGDG